MKINCIVCEEEISDKAKKCPFCNSDQVNAKKWKKVIDELKYLLSSEEEIENAKENVVEFIENELEGIESLEKSGTTILAFCNHNFDEYEEYNMTNDDDFELYEEESQEIISIVLYDRLLNKLRFEQQIKG